MREETKFLNVAFINILLVNFFIQMGQQMTNVLVPKYTDSLGASAYIVGIVSSVFAISSLLARPVTSPAFDSFNKKKLLVVSILGLFIVFAGYAFSKSVPALIGFRLLHGILLGSVAPLSLAIASNVLPETKIGKGIGIFSLCQAVGQAVGPNLGLNLSRSIGYKFTFLIGTSVIFIALLLAIFMKDPDDHREPYRISLDKIIEKNSIPSTILMFFLILSYSCVGGYLAIYGDLLNIQNIGLYFTVYAICLFLTRPISGVLLDKFGYGKVLIPSLLCFASSFVVIAVSRNLIGFLIAAVLSACGYGVCYPTVQSLSMNLADRNRRGAAGSTSYIGADLGILIGASVAGYIIDKIAISTGSEITGYSSMYFIMIIPILLGLLYYLIAKKSINRRLEQKYQLVNNGVE